MADCGKHCLLVVKVLILVIILQNSSAYIEEVGATLKALQMRSCTAVQSPPAACTERF